MSTVDPGATIAQTGPPLLRSPVSFAASYPRDVAMGGTDHPVRRILVAQSNHGLCNLGDLAMLQVAVTRLRHLFPSARIDAITSDPRRLARFCPDATALPWQGVGQWALTPLLDRRRLPGVIHDPALRRLNRARLRGGGMLRCWLQLAIAMRAGDDGPMLRYLDAVKAADLVIASGGGHLCDPFESQARMVLASLGLGQALGKPTAAFGLGIGPATTPYLKNTFVQVLKRLRVLGLREARSSPQILRSLHAAPEQMVVTGDDAVALAYARRRDRIGSDLGVNLRIANYSGAVAGRVAEIRQVLRHAGTRYGAELVPLPVALQPEDSDVAGIARVLEESARWAVPDGPAEVIERAGRCRAVITGSYHGGVFALAQGVPVVALAMSEYYMIKMQGLAEMFPGGCRLVRLDQPDLAERLSAALNELWAAAPNVREQLLAAARRQIAQGEYAYAAIKQSASATGAVTRDRVGADHS